MKNIFITLVINVISTALFAQYCPSEAADDADSKCDLVQLNGNTQSINNNTSFSGCESYSDFTSLANADLNTGQSYNVNIMQGTCGDDYDRFCNAWIDFNGDGDFTDAGEALSTGSSSSPNSGFIHSFNFNVPSSAAGGITRMRVIVIEGSIANNPCANYQWGETEDYSIEIIPANIPPVADFEANTTSTCNGLIQLTDLSTNSPTSWDWDFGDTNGSTLQNPSHTYSSNGLYSVTLIATNQYGSDSVTFTNYITVNTSGALPVSANCSPQTLSPSAGFGISNVTFGSINNNSGDGTNGIEDFTCNSATMISGVNYPISITTDTPQPHNVRAWIDYNNDGSFSNSSELILSADASLLSEDTVFIPAAVILNTPLRMRVMADWYLQVAPDGCSDVQNGQAEDYTIIIEPNTNPPEAEFNVDLTLSCNGDITFSDLSTNVPTSWEWDFGDGTVSAQQNPIHHFDTSGTYSVSLVVTNAFGTDTTIYANLIEVNYAGMVNSPNCAPITTSNCCGYGIYRVNFEDINKSSADGSDSYQDYTCTDNTMIDQGGCYVIEINTGVQNPEDVKVWIDFNNDSNFDDNTELVLESLNKYLHNGIIEIPATGIVTDTPLVMRVMSESIGNTIESCTNLLFGQTEDYAVVINSGSPVPSVFFSADVFTSCDGIINFTDESCGGIISWSWDFGDGSTSNSQNPTHNYSAPGIYDVSLEVSNGNGINSDTLFQYIEVISLFGEPVTPDCAPQTISPFDDLGIHHFVLNTINKWSNPGFDGYQDFSCTEQTILDPGGTYSIFITTSAEYEEDVYVWIDFNNNGDFNFNEQVFDSQSNLENHTGNIFIPTNNLTYGTPLRMRVWSDFSQGFGFINACDEPEYGQVEDYAVIIQDPNSPPIANFTVDSTLMCAGTVQFTNQSSSSASYYNWFFGDGGTSNLQNPSYTYSSPGIYDVTLVVGNINGDDTLTFTNYIEYAADCNGIGVEEISLEDKLEIYPNPTKGNFTIKFESENDYSIQIVNMLGQNIFNRSNVNSGALVNVDLNSQIAGVYFVHIIDDSGTTTKRIILK